MKGQFLHAFCASKQVEQLNQEFAGAVSIYRERWHVEPSAVHIRPQTMVPREIGNICIVEDGRIAPGLWYFEVAEEVIEAN